MSMRWDCINKGRFVFIGKFTVTFCLCAVIVWTVFDIINDYQLIWARGTAARLNRLKPSFDDLKTYLTREGELTISREQLRQYARYFEKVTDIMPGNADAYGILGFCYHYLGQEKRAVASYNRAIVFSPEFISFYYNLGLIFFQRGQYDEAANVFGRAVALNHANNLKHVVSSKVFFPLIRDVDNLAHTVTQKFEQRYRDSHELLVLSHYHLNQFERMFTYAQEGLSKHRKGRAYFYFYSGVAAYHLKRYQEAVFFLKEAIKKRLEHGQVYHFLGLALQGMGREDTAQRIFNKAVYLRKPDDSLFLKAGQMPLKVF